MLVKIFSKIVKFLIFLSLIALTFCVWFVFENWNLIEKILFTALIIGIKFLDIVYSHFKNFVDAEGSRIKIFTDHIVDEYNEYILEQGAEVEFKGESEEPEVEQIEESVEEEF